MCLLSLFITIFFIFLNEFQRDCILIFTKFIFCELLENSKIVICAVLSIDFQRKLNTFKNDNNLCCFYSAYIGVHIGM